MSDSPTPVSGDNLNFDKAEFTTATPPSSPHQCALCQRQLVDSYFQFNDRRICPGCQSQIAGQLGAPSRARRLSKALGAGLVAAIAGAALYYGVVALTGYELGLIGVVVGFMVGWAVRWGSEHRGGWLYQTIAIALTYFAIVSMYIPAVIKGLDGAAPDPNKPALGAPAINTPPETAPPPKPRSVIGRIVFAAIIFIIACLAPFLAGLQNIIGWIIIAFSLYEAWKLNRGTPLHITGPHPLDTLPSPLPNS